MPQQLSKSHFVAGCQCHGLLWWTVHEPDAPELVPDMSLEDKFEQGHQVGELARSYVPGGVLIDLPRDQVEQRLAATREALAAGAPAGAVVPSADFAWRAAMPVLPAGAQQAYRAQAHPLPRLAQCDSRSGYGRSRREAPRPSDGRCSGWTHPARDQRCACGGVGNGSLQGLLGIYRSEAAELPIPCHARDCFVARSSDRGVTLAPPPSGLPQHHRQTKSLAPGVPPCRVHRD